MKQSAASAPRHVLASPSYKNNSHNQIDQGTKLSKYNKLSGPIYLESIRYLLIGMHCYLHGSINVWTLYMPNYAEKHICIHIFHISSYWNDKCSWNPSSWLSCCWNKNMILQILNCYRCILVHHLRNSFEETWIYLYFLLFCNFEMGWGNCTISFPTLLHVNLFKS